MTGNPDLRTCTPMYHQIISFGYIEDEDGNLEGLSAYRVSRSAQGHYRVVEVPFASLYKGHCERIAQMVNGRRR